MSEGIRNTESNKKNKQNKDTKLIVKQEEEKNDINDCDKEQNEKSFYYKVDLLIGMYRLN